MFLPFPEWRSYALAGYVMLCHVHRHARSLLSSADKIPLLGGATFNFCAYVLLKSCAFETSLQWKSLY